MPFPSGSVNAIFVGNVEH
jgi:hypothetical protein